MLYSTNLNRTCWICGNDVPTTDGLKDELGNPVHEPCLAARAELASAANASAKKSPSRISGDRTRTRSIRVSRSPRR
jgi:hypothetical protein